MLKRLLLIVLLVCLFSIPGFGANVECRALWVECEGSNDTLSSKQKVDDMIARVSDMNCNAIFVQIYRANRAWYDSDIVDKTPFLNFKKKERA